MKIAVIGGIGSGKSEVMKVAKEMGITCLSADEINDALLHEPVYISKIASRFPECVAHGAVDKPKLASVVFSDEKKRRALNDIAHPEIARRIAECDADPLAVELPLALESGMATAFDEVILVSAPKSRCTSCSRSALRASVRRVKVRVFLIWRPRASRPKSRLT